MACAWKQCFSSFETKSASPRFAMWNPNVFFFSSLLMCVNCTRCIELWNTQFIMNIITIHFVHVQRILLSWKLFAIFRNFAYDRKNSFDCDVSIKSRRGKKKKKRDLSWTLPSAKYFKFHRTFLLLIIIDSSEEKKKWNDSTHRFCV